jgi:hypothetical protein
MERIGVWLVALATAVLCVAAGAPAALANGGKTIAEAPGLEFGTPVHGSLYDNNFYAGYSVAYWTVGFGKGDRISIKTKARASETPPCQIIYMPGTDDTSIGPTTPILDSASTTRDGSVDGQTWVASQKGIYVLAMTNNDIYLSGPHQCLDAPSRKPFTFTVNVSHEGSRKHSGSAGSDDKAGGGSTSGSGSTHVVEPGQSLWVIAQGILGRPASIAQVAFEVGRLWQLNSARIGSGDPDLIYAGQELRLK